MLLIKKKQMKRISIPEISLFSEKLKRISALSNSRAPSLSLSSYLKSDLLSMVSMLSLEKKKKRQEWEINS